MEKTTNTAKEVRRSHSARTKVSVFAEFEAPTLAMSSWVSTRSNRPILSCRYVKHVILLASCSSRCILSEEREREGAESCMCQIFFIIFFFSFLHAKTYAFNAQMQAKKKGESWFG